MFFNSINESCQFYSNKNNNIYVLIKKIFFSKNFGYG